MKTLHLTLKKKWFDQILEGKKTEEFREVKPYWTKRLHNQHFDVVVFKNGYSKGVPEMTWTIKGIYIKNITSQDTGEQMTVFAISLGVMIESKNIHLDNLYEQNHTLMEEVINII